VEMENPLVQEVKQLVVDACNLESIDISPDDINPDEVLVGPDSPYDIDSLDAIEIVAAVEKKYVVRINNVDTAQKVLKSVRILADFITQKQKEKAVVL